MLSGCEAGARRSHFKAAGWLSAGLSGNQPSTLPDLPQAAPERANGKLCGRCWNDEKRQKIYIAIFNRLLKYYYLYIKICKYYIENFKVYIKSQQMLSSQF